MRMKKNLCRGIFLVLEAMFSVFCVYLLFFDGERPSGALFHELRFVWLAMFLLSIAIVATITVCQKERVSRNRFLGILVVLTALPITEVLLMILRLYVFVEIFHLIFFS